MHLPRQLFLTSTAKHKSKAAFEILPAFTLFQIDVHFHFLQVWWTKSPVDTSFFTHRYYVCIFFSQYKKRLRSLLVCLFPFLLHIYSKTTFIDLLRCCLLLVVFLTWTLALHRYSAPFTCWVQLIPSLCLFQSCLSPFEWWWSSNTRFDMSSVKHHKLHFCGDHATA